MSPNLSATQKPATPKADRAPRVASSEQAHPENPDDTPNRERRTASKHPHPHPHPTSPPKHTTTQSHSSKNYETPWNKQREILTAIRDHRFVAVRSCNAFGKAYAAALAILWWLMTHGEALVITTAPSDRQVKETIWREIKTIHHNNKSLIGGKITATRLELSNKRFA